jgi:cytoskeletal protein RodZ
MLPGPTFVKSFLRTYAEFLGLDPHLLVEEYRARHDPRDESELTPFARAPRGRERRRPRRRPSWLPLAAAVIAILALLLILGLTGNNSSDTSTQTSTTTTGTAKAKPKKTAAQHHHHARPVPTKVHVRIVPAAATYVCVDKGVGTAIVYEGTLAAPKSWTARHLRFNLGRRAIRLTVNGKTVPVPQGADPIGYDIRLHSIRVIPPTQRRPCG